jgi:hypothetical protein
MGSVAWRLVPDVEAAFRRFPVTVLFVFVASGLLFAFADTDIFAFARGAGGVAPTAPVLFVVSLTAIFASFAIEQIGPARGWSRAMCLVLAVAVTVLLAALQHLPLVAPCLSALWLPIDMDRAAFGVGLLALAASASPLLGADANTRILFTLGIVVAASIVVALPVILLSGAFSGPGQLTPVPQVIIFIAASLLALSWLAALASGDGASSGHAAVLGTQTEVLRRLVLPIMLVLLLALAASIARRLGQGDIPSMQGVPQIVGPAAAILLLITGTYLHSAQLAGVGQANTLVTTFVKVAPFIMAAVGAIVCWGLWREIEASQTAMPELPGMARPLGAIHITDSVGRWVFGVIALVMTVLAIALPAWRDLRLPLIIGGVAMILSGVGPLSLDRLASARFAADFKEALTVNEATANGILKPAEAITWTAAGQSRVEQVVQWLARTNAMGALEPAFRGAANNPFTGPDMSPQALQGAIMARLNVAAIRQPLTPTGEPPPRVRQLQLVANRQSTQAILPLAGFDSLAGPISLSTWMPVPGIPTPQIRLDGQGPVETKPALPPQPDFRSAVTADGSITITRSNGATVRFDLRPVLKLLLEYEDQRRAYLERNKNIAHGAPRPAPVPPLMQPQVLDAISDGIKARLIVERLTGHEVNGAITVSDAMGWLLYNRADLEAKP